jgi:putative ABC transport system ATP-binding protein
VSGSRPRAPVRADGRPGTDRCHDDPWQARAVVTEGPGPGPGLRFEAVVVRADPPAPRRGRPAAAPTTILDGIDLAIEPGRLTVIAGPSGSGKSTLLRLGNRLEVPTSGRVLLDGVDIASIDPLALRRRAAMVFQRPVVFAGTALDNLRVARPDLGLEAAATALAGVGLDAAILDRRADDLSGGEAQRLCIARSLLTEPEILLMDEATSALDVDARLAVEQLTRSLGDRGLTVIWVTHDLEQAERIADRIVVVVDGAVVGDEAAADAVARRSFAGLAAPAGPTEGSP